MPRAKRHARALQIVFLLVLVFSTVQALWWIYDQNQLAGRIHERTRRAYEVELRLAATLLEHGEPVHQVRALAPHILLGDGTQAVAVDPAALAALDAERRGHLRRYLWEGGFFLTVLIACMAVIWRTLREEALLRRRQDNFVAAVTHELKSPLASLQLSAETIKLRQPSAERLGELVDRMRGDIGRLENMVSQILDTARLEARGSAVEKEPLPLRRVVEAAVADLGERATTAKVEVTVAVPDELVISANPSSTRTVIRNLLENALHATAARGGGHIELVGRAHDGHIHLVAKDDGVGFEPSEAARLFDKFYRPGDELRRGGRGAGLGLYIVDRLMQLERGWVAAQSEGPGRGATFTVAWPRSRELEGTRQAAAGKPAPASATPAKSSRAAARTSSTTP
jgi:signal transduction histidine kinase